MNTLKICLWLPWMLLALATAACTPTLEENPDTNTAEDFEQTENGSRYLVLFCSRSGNTAQVAREIQKSLSCDLLEVRPSEAYPDNYNTMLERAQEELEAIRQGHYPPISTHLKDLNEYQVLFVGYPIWYGSMATPMQTFLHEHASELAGKRIALFATSGTSNLATSAKEAAALCPEAEILPQTLLLTSSSLAQMGTQVEQWLQQMGLCGGQDSQDDGNLPPLASANTLRITVGASSFTATLTENRATEALKRRLAQGSIRIRMDDYGNMEKVGTLGFSLPQDDTSIQTSPGDIVLYQGNSLAIFYGTNTWRYTLLGRINGASSSEQVLRLLGGKGQIDIILSLEP